MSNSPPPFRTSHFKFLITPCIPSLLWALAAFAARCFFLPTVRLGGRFYFADPDCYMRLVRVRWLHDHGAWFLRNHPFENFPEGLVSHATAPLDWLLLALAKLWPAPFPDSLHVAGVYVGPLLGAAGALALGFALPSETPARLRHALFAAYTFLPPLAWAQAIGRPDHQALLIALLPAALALEARRLPGRDGAQRAAYSAGFLWGLLLWTSLWEPLILLAALLLLQPLLRGRHTLRLLATALGVVALARCFDGWRLQSGTGLANPALHAWLNSLGEIRPPSPWLVLWMALPPLALLAWRWKANPRRILSLSLTVLGVVLASWQFRWMPYSALLFTAAVLPPLASLTPRSFQHAATALALWLLAGLAFELAHTRPPRTQAALHDISGCIGGDGSILAPWWQSAQLLYETGHPVVGTSAHTGWSGIQDTCRFYAGTDFPAARALLNRRGVRWIVVWSPQWLIPLSRQILGISGQPGPLLLDPGERFHLVALRLWENSALTRDFQPAFFDPTSDFRLYLYTPLASPGPAPEFKVP